MNITELTLKELSKKFQNKALTSTAITEAFIKNIESQDSAINAFVTTTFDEARQMAKVADERQKTGKFLSPIDGMPIGLKDVVCTKNIRTTASSNILKDFIPPYDATVWAKLKAAGAVLLGKLNTDEFTMGGSTETSAFGVTKNPRDLSRVAGGSSGGSAAAIAANMCTATIGTDTGGSIRQPASFCGVTGLKVSYGRVSRYGTIPMASSLDTIGALAKTTEDCAIVLNIIAGKDELDSTTPPTSVPDYTSTLNEEIKNLTIGIPKEYFSDEIDQEVQNAVKQTQQVLETQGCKIKKISLKHTKYAVPAYYIIAPSEISANMSRFDGIRFGSGKQADNLEDIYTETREEGFGDEVKRRILIGTYALSAGYYDAFYKKAQKVRTLIKQDFKEAFNNVDAIICPVAPTPAFKIGQNTSNPLKMYLEDILTIPASLAGICGISIPTGNSHENLPIGTQILAPPFQEAKLLNIAHKIEQKLKV